MKVSIDKSEIKGKLAAPPSKSYTIRGLMCAALAGGESKIISPLDSDDTGAASEVLGQIEVGVKKEGGLWRVRGDNFREPAGDLFCRDSATTFRFMAAISSLVPGRCRLVPGSSLSKRPIRPLLEALVQLGVSCRVDNGVVVVDGGRLKGGAVELRGDISSQFVSALLFVAPLAEKEVTINLTTPPESRPYLEMTLDCLERFGVKVKVPEDLRRFGVSRQEYKPANFVVEGDWSSASYLLALGAVSGEVEVTSLNPESLQGDKIMLNLLQEMGAKVAVGNNRVRVRKSKLKAIEAELSDFTDLLPTLAVLAVVADGKSRLAGISRARLKESNRVLALREGLERMGIEVVEEEDSLTITGGGPRGSVIDSHNDHRIAMAFGVLGTAVSGITIEGAECVSKTYPDFWDILKSLGGKVRSDVQ